MDIVSLTYVSRARKGLKSSEVDDIQRASLIYNPMDGVTGLLLFNGEAFLQIIEGAETAIDSLVERLKKDPRHHSMGITHRRPVDRRFFSHWSMHRINLGPLLEDGLMEVERHVDPLIDRPMQRSLRRSLSLLFTRQKA